MSRLQGDLARHGAPLGAHIHIRQLRRADLRRQVGALQRRQDARQAELHGHVQAQLVRHQAQAQERLLAEHVGAARLVKSLQLQLRHHSLGHDRPIRGALARGLARGPRRHHRSHGRRNLLSLFVRCCYLLTLN